MPKKPRPAPICTRHNKQMVPRTWEFWEGARKRRPGEMSGRLGYVCLECVSHDRGKLHALRKAS